MKKRSEETQALRAGCSKTPQTPFPGARDGQNLISWRWSFTFTFTFTYKPNLVRIDACNFELSW